MLQLKGIVKEYGGRRLLASVDLHIRPSDRIGLCGENGAGKTTLLRMFAGDVSPDDGTLQMARATTVGYLPQEGLTHGGRSLFTEVRSAVGDLLALEDELKLLEDRISRQHGTADLERYAVVREQFEQQGGYQLEAEIGKVLSGLGFSEQEWEKPCEQFSGGWQMRIALAKLLLQQPTLLLLDEPTNHLDLPARDWLEGYLASYPHAVVLVSHDRFFLDQVVGRIVEVWNGHLTEYPGNYSRYLQQREERVAALREAKRRQDEEIERIEAFISRFRYQANKASLVQSRVKQLEKIERITVPPVRKKIGFRFPQPPKGGRIAIELFSACQCYGENTVLHEIDLIVERGVRIALVGPNGAGKSTLMRMLSGTEAPASGERRAGHGLELAYFAQDQAQVLDPRLTVLEQISQEAPFDMVPRLRDILGAFLFSGDDTEKRVEVLSGGERNRLALAILLLRPANLLLLDEPTNHLDLASKQVLLEALRGYSGTLVFVSHDRYFVDHLATRVVEVGDGQVHSWPGNYSDFLHAKELRGDSSHSELRVEQKGLAGGEEKTTKEDRRTAHANRKAAQRIAERRAREILDMESRIEKVEGDVAAWEEDMARADFYADADHAEKVIERHRADKEALAQLYDKWEALQLDAAAAE
ncbi:MAG: ABC transporter ATP-binding protein [Desulfuromonas sp.]|nr:MAG: ABC transporter ATP-binding protein [Desulfuromonas sp.]